jgi:hypothetical protein
MSLTNTRIVAGDGIQINNISSDVSLPDTDSILLYEHADKLAYMSRRNSTQRYVVGVTPPVTVTGPYTCTRNDDQVFVDSRTQAEVSVVLPEGVDGGKMVTVTDIASVSLTNPIRVTATGGVHHDNDVLINANGMSLTFMYSEMGWVLV